MSASVVDLSADLRAAAEWRLLAQLLSRPRPGWHDEVLALARECRDERLGAAAAAADGAREGDYHALLGAGGVASPRAAAHAGFLDPGHLLADLGARYAAFGFSPGAEEPDDHLSVECDFVSYLLLKEVYARARGEDEAAAVTRDARTRFLAEHVAPVGHRFAEKLPGDAPAHLIAAASCLVERLPPAPFAGDGDRDDDPLRDGCPAACGPGARDGIAGGCSEA